MKKRLFGIFLSLALVLSMMPMGMMVAQAAEDGYPLYIAGTQVTSENADNITGTGITGSVSYNAQTNTLTLDGATINNTTPGQIGAAIQYTGTGTFTISASGTNTVTDSVTRTTDTHGAESAGISVGELGSFLSSPPLVNLVIDVTEGASLTVNGGKASGSSYPNSYGITNQSAGSITIQGAGTLTANGGECTNWSYGIHTWKGGITFNSTGTIKAYGHNNSNSYGILTHGDVTINSGTFDVQGAAPADYTGYGFGNANLTINGGKVTIRGSANAFCTGYTLTLGKGVSASASSVGDISVIGPYEPEKLSTYKYISTIYTAPPVTEYDLWVAGTQVTSANAEDLSVISGVTVTDGGEARYDSETNTLTLKNASIDGAADITNTIYVPDGASEFNISFAGTNTITARNSSDYCRAVNALGVDLVLSGGEEATLTIRANMSGDSPENGGLRVGSLTITGGTVTVECPAENSGPAHNPYSISLNKNASDVLKVTGGKLVSKGWEPLFYGGGNFSAAQVDSATTLRGTTSTDGAGLEPYDYATNSDYSGGSYNSTYRYVEAVPNEAGGINIAFTVTPPKAGEKTHDIGNSAVISGGNDQYLVVGDLYGISIDAVDSFRYFEGTFAASTPYYSYALIIPADGESLPLLTSENVTITGGTFVKSEAQDDGSARVYFSITPTEIATVIDRATFTIDIPSDGASIYDPISVSTTDMGYTIAADALWDMENGFDTLQAGQTYNLVLPLKPDSGYVFADSVSVAVNGGAAVTVTAQEGLAGWTNLSVPVTIPESAPTPSPSGGGSTIFPVISPAEMDNAEVTVSPKNAVVGQTVTVTVTPDEGYKVDSVTVTDKDGKEIEVTYNGDGTYSFKMPASKVTVTPVIIEDGDVPLVNRPFVDVPEDSWFYDAVYYCYDNGSIKGVDETHFAPNDTTTRAMIVTILWRMEGAPSQSASQTALPVGASQDKLRFEDVEKGSWYEAAVKWAAEKEIVKGMSETTFAPTAKITREQMATILARYAEFKGKKGDDYAVDLSGFADLDSVSDWALDAMNWCVATELMKGVTETTLDPKGNATRAQVAVLMQRMCENIL